MENITFNIPESLKINSNIKEIKPLSDESKLKEFYEVQNRIKIIGYNEMEKYAIDNINLIVDSANANIPLALTIISNRDFLTALSTHTYAELDDEHLRKFNRIVRAYIQNTNSKYYNKECANLMMECAHIFNNRNVNMLQAIGLPLNTSIWLVVQRYSSNDERQCIKRLVRTIQKSDIEIMTEGVIGDIFQRLCSDSMTNLFCTIMQDRFTKFFNNNENELYSTVSNVVLELMEKAMSYKDMEKVLITYIDELNKSGKKGRFYLNSINSGDYPRINMVLEKLDSSGVDFI